MRVDLFIRFGIAVTEIEERLPIHEAPWRPLPASKVGMILRRTQLIIENKGKEFLAGLRPEIRAVTGTHLGMAEPIGRDRKLDGNRGVVLRIVELGAFGQLAVHEIRPDGL